jgi:hypothetical protein
MKLHELLTEGKKQVDEAPMGTLSGLANKAMSKMGSDRATGKLSTGATANQLNKEFQLYLGKTGREATKDAVMGFLSSKGYPTQGAATIINQALKSTGSAPAPTGPMANLKTTAKGVAASAKQALTKKGGELANKAATGASNLINKATDAMGKVPLPNKADRREFEKPGSEPAVDAAKTPGSFNNQLAGGKANYSTSTGFDPKTMKNVGKPLGTDVVGNVSNTKKKKVAVSAGKINKGKVVAEAKPGVLPRNIIDKAILKAAQEAEIVNTKQGKTSATQAAAGGIQPDAGSAEEPTTSTSISTPTSTKSSGGFGAGFKQGLTGKTQTAPDVAELEKRIAAIEKKVGLA